MKITIDIISDVICPWCYVGKRRLEKAIALAGFDDVHVSWHPFELNPTMPKMGMNRKDYRTAKFGSWDRSLELDAQVTEVGETEGIPFHFDRIERTPNTIDAHRLIGLAGKHGVQDAVVEALFRAYFIEGADITQRHVLLNVATEAGLARGRAEFLLNGDDGIAAIHAAEDQFRSAGVQGVPRFTINGTMVLSGAMRATAFLEAFSRAGLEMAASREGSFCKMEPGEKASC